MTHHEGHHAKHGQPQGEAQKPAPAPAEADLRKPLEAKTKEAAELLDQLQRVAAEYSNFQKRCQRNLEEEKNMAVRGLVVDLLPALDNFDRALAAAQKQPTYESLLAGVTLVHNQLLAALARHGVTPVEAGGQMFDPEHHEAVACLPSDTHAAGQVIEQLQRGYQLHGRTIRPAHVSVSGGAAPAAEGQAKEPSPADEAEKPPEPQA